MGAQSASPTTNTAALTSSQVDWWTIHCHVDPFLKAIGSWPIAGTPAWQQLDDGDPSKRAALFDAARRWALRVDAYQDAMAQASQAISAAEDWAAIAANKTSKSARIARRKEFA